MYKKEMVFLVVLLFVIGAYTPIISSKTDMHSIDIENLFVNSIDLDKSTSLLTLYTFDKTGRKQNTVELPSDIAVEIKDLFDELEYKIVYEPTGIETQELKNSFIDLIDEYGLISEKQSKEKVFSLLNPGWLKQVKNNNPRFRNYSSGSSINPLSDSYFGKSFFCSVSSVGTGMMMPLFMLPRPRAIAIWYSVDAISSVASLLTGKGFLAGGVQSGLLLGFMGIGLTYAIPGETIYGFIGYSLFAGISAEYIEFLPHNRVPVISNENPEDYAIDVPINLTELSFKIRDEDRDLMDYQVTTYPNIGSGEGFDKKNGVYSIPISGLEDKTQYSWTVTVSDGIDTAERSFSFTTAAIAPIVSNPVPTNGEMDVPLSLSNLSFTLKDYQGDLMDYTVETSPEIGSGSGQDVIDGIYSVSVAGLNYSTKYYWFVNVTDGIHWTNKVFSFQTEFIMVFDPFEEGWQYRKKIAINHSMVSGDLVNFPVLISTIDLDLKEKAQVDADDIIFMDNVGVANRLYHEIENFNSSSGELVAWVKIPNLSSSQDTDCYMYYGNTGCSSQQHPEKVWNSNFKAVWHLNNDPINSIYDSTAEDNDGLVKGGMTSSNLVMGKIGPCLYFDGVNDFISLVEFTNSFDKGACFAWVQTTSNKLAAVWGEANKYDDKPYILLGKYSNDMLTFARDIYGVDSNYQGRLSVGINDGQWHHIAWLSGGSGNGNAFYFDGQQVLLNWQDEQDPNGIWFDDQSTNTHSIGNLDRPTNDWQWMGLLDEIRITNEPLSAIWIITEYTNQNNPTDFISIELEVQHP